jgi:hypothetical protein
MPLPLDPALTPCSTPPLPSPPAHNACLLTVLVWAGRHDLAHAIFGSDAGATLARRFEAASAPRGARRAPSGALALLGAEAQDAPQQLMQGGW